MQFAVNTVIFFLGLTLAKALISNPRRCREEIVKFLNKLCSVTNGFRTTASPADVEQRQQLSPDEKNKALREVTSEPTALLTKHEVEHKYGMDDWQRLAYEDFKRTITARGPGLKAFPCVYATMGYRANDHRYVFLESDNAAEPRNIRILAPALLEYLRIATTLGDNTSLVVFSAPSDVGRSVEEYNAIFWDTLWSLRLRDRKPWPADIPHDAQDKDWTFCFDGQSIFPISFSPAHSNRWSRHQCVPVVALQPKWVLDKLLGTPDKREAATAKVRKLLREYDQVEISPDLTSYGQPGTSEVRQLCLLDHNETAKCPYKTFDTGFMHPKVKDEGRVVEGIS